MTLRPDSLLCTQEVKLGKERLFQSRAFDELMLDLVKTKLIDKVTKQGSFDKSVLNTKSGKKVIVCLCFRFAFTAKSPATSRGSAESKPVTKNCTLRATRETERVHPNRK